MKKTERTPEHEEMKKIEITKQRDKDKKEGHEQEETVDDVIKNTKDQIEATINTSEDK